MLKVKNLTKIYKNESGDVTAVDDVSFTVPDGKFASIIGKSGSGKSTLLSLLGALDAPTSGLVEVAGRDVTKLRGAELNAYRNKEIGFVFQNYHLIPNLTAVENVMLPMEFAGVPKEKREKRSRELLKEVDLGVELEDRLPGKMSGGQQQRVAIARALANSPALVLADEPTGNLDAKTSRVVFDLLKNLSRREKVTIVIVTHDLDIAKKTDLSFVLTDGKLKKGAGKSWLD
jgi:putative ABC transport system ATP-binding protein